MQQPQAGQHQATAASVSQASPISTSTSYQMVPATFAKNANSNVLIKSMIPSTSQFQPNNGQTVFIGQYMPNQQQALLPNSIKPDNKTKYVFPQGSPHIQPKAPLQGTISQPMMASHLRPLSNNLIAAQAATGLVYIPNLAGNAFIGPNNTPFIIRAPTDQVLIQTSSTQLPGQPYYQLNQPVASMHMMASGASTPVISVSSSQTLTPVTNTTQSLVAPTSTAVSLAPVPTNTQSHPIQATAVGTGNASSSTPTNKYKNIKPASHAVGTQTAVAQVQTNRTKAGESGTKSTGKTVGKQGKAQAAKQAVSVASVTTGTQASIGGHVATQITPVGAQIFQPSKSFPQIRPAPHPPQSASATTSVSLTTVTPPVRHAAISTQQMGQLHPMTVTLVPQASVPASMTVNCGKNVSWKETQSPVKKTVRTVGIDAKLTPSNTVKPTTAMQTQESSKISQNTEKTNDKDIASYFENNRKILAANKVKPPAQLTATSNDSMSMETVNGAGKAQAIVRPQILTHVIENYVIKESREPFSPLVSSSTGGGKIDDDDDEFVKNVVIEQPNRNVQSEKEPMDISVNESVSTLTPSQPIKPKLGNTCEHCGKPATKSFKKNKKSRRFCSTLCANSFPKRLDLFNPVVNKVVSAGIGTVPVAPIVSENEKMVETMVERTVQPVKTVTIKSSNNETNGDQSSTSHSFVPRSGSNPLNWSVQDVSDYILNETGCQEAADAFLSQEIDGKALLLVKEDHMTKSMDIKIGPALKIYSIIQSLIKNKSD